MPTVAIFLSFFFSQLCWSEAVLDTPNPWTLNLHFENDLFDNADSNYTNGVRASSVSSDLSGLLVKQQQTYAWLNQVNQLLEPFHPPLASAEKINQNIIFSVGQLIFTPANRQKRVLDKTDRPYAGWLYGGIGYQQRTADRSHNFELNLGLVGPAALARQTQDCFHDILSMDRFQGWENQLHNELGIQMVFERKRRFKPLKSKIFNHLNTDLITHWGASLGNVATYLNAGAQMRVGWLLPSDFGTSTLRPGGDSNSPERANPLQRKLQVQGFIASDTRLVAHNIFLDGNTFSNSHSVKKRNLVSDITVGVSSSYKRWSISYSHIYRSKEFKGQSRGQKYGSLSLSYTY